MIHEQAEMLYDCIRSSCDQSHATKQPLRMLLDVEDLQAYMECAIDQLSQSLKDPFDFVQASIVNSPIPFNFAGNILKLAISITQNWNGEIDAEGLFRYIGFMVASCIMLDSSRHKKSGRFLL